MTMKEFNRIILANVAVIGLALVSLVSIWTVQPLYPYDGLVTGDRTPSFEWTGLPEQYELLIDDDENFETPLTFEVTGNRHSPAHDLEFGTYWWKVTRDGIETEPRQFTIVSTVALSRPERSLVINSGNTELLVYLGGITGAFVLGVNETIEVGEDENVKAEQH